MTKSLVLGSSIFPTRASFSKHSLLQELTAPPPPPVDPFAALDALEELAGPGPEDDVTPIVAPELQARSTGVRRNRMNIDIYRHSVTVVFNCLLSDTRNSCIARESCWRKPGPEWRVQWQGEAFRTEALSLQWTIQRGIDYAKYIQIWQYNNYNIL